MKNWLIVVLSLFSSLSFADSADIPEVMMGNYLVASEQQYPAIQTYGVATCIAVTLYDPVMKQGALLHVSAVTRIPQALTQVLTEMERAGSVRTHIQAQLHGGWDVSMGELDGMNYTSYLSVNELVEEFSRRQIYLIQNSTLVTKSEVDLGAPAIINIELNLSNGAVYQYQQSVPFAQGDISRPMP